jgi:gamma-glutamyltranspeptidase/glutathione hydrolase
MIDAARYVADPRWPPCPWPGCWRRIRRERRGLIRRKHALIEPAPGLPAGSDTVYLCAADGEGNAVSFINSLYLSFGSASPRRAPA